MLVPWRVAVPALLTTAPLLGVSLRSDERRTVYEHALEHSSNPWSAADAAVREIGTFLTLGNFRPIGRFLDYFEHGLLFDIAHTTGLPPQVVNSVIRAAMIVALVFTVGRLMARIGAPRREDPVASPPDTRRREMAGVAMAIVLVAGGFGNGLVVFSFLFIGAAILTLWVPMWVVRDSDLDPRRVSRVELVGVFVLGAAMAATYDMVYLVPPITLAYLAARSYVVDLGWAAVRRSAAARRVVALWAGFVTVFVPIRLVIAQRCTGTTCYDGSEIRLHIDAGEAFVVRMISAGPPTGWAYNTHFVNKRDVPYGLDDALSSAFFIIAALVLCVMVARLVHRPAPAPTNTALQTKRATLALVGFGATVTTLAALLVSLATRIQVDGPAPGGGWRESSLTQTGVGIVLAALLGALAEWVAGRRPGRARQWRTGLTVVLSVALVATLFANQQMSVFDRQDPESATSNAIGVALVNFADTKEANSRRCLLAAQYAALTVGQFNGGDETLAIFDELSMQRHGRPFCDG